MESIVNCDKCYLRFNDGEYLPKIFPCCGVTYCMNCINKYNTNRQLNKVVCDQCEKQYDDASQLITNSKLLKIAIAVQNQS